MVFSSLLFVCIFLPATLILYNLSKNIIYKNVILVIASLIFYAWGEPVWVFALLFSAMLDYVNGRIIHKFFGRWQAKAALISSLVINLGILMTFKYMGFFIENINSIFHINIPFNGFNLPLGISFYTFQTLSYTIDMYRGKVEVQKNPLNYLCYISMFPQLVAGPIVRYADIAKQINDRRVTLKGFECGIIRFTQGMFKKVVLANGAGTVAASILDGNLSSLPAATAWLGILMYSFQIYFDFSGYSDMAIGLGKMFGFEFLENFNYPYISKNVTEFWRRWHMSLGTFFRDYVYIPLGGNRRHQIFNIMVVWMLTGFWHGASWNFILWGLYYGILLIIEKKAFGGRLMRMPAFFGIIYNSVAVLIGWSLFYFTDFSRLGQFFAAAFGGSGMLWNYETLTIFLNNIWFILACFIMSTPIIKQLYRFICKNRVLGGIVTPIFVTAVLAFCFILLVGQTYNPFLYFRF